MKLTQKYILNNKLTIRLVDIAIYGDLTSEFIRDHPSLIAWNEESDVFMIDKPLNGKFNILIYQHLPYNLILEFKNEIKKEDLQNYYRRYRAIRNFQKVWLNKAYKPLNGCMFVKLLNEFYL